MSTPKAAIFGCKTTSLLNEERRFFEQLNPIGFILFARNIDTPEQVKALVDELKSCVNHPDVLILIDQEGGRVARLTPPHWDEYPTGKIFADLAIHNLADAKEAIYLNYRLIGADLHALGINVDCAPVLDIPVDGSDNIIGDRALGTTTAQISVLGRAVCEGLQASGVLPVIKHIPGHGRATVDSHLSLPTVDTAIEELERTDFAPFQALADAPLAMTAHITYQVVDKNNCATMSKAMINLIRDNIGFDGLLMSDDFSMKALGGSFTTRTEQCFYAGCDVALHCNGDFDEMLEIAASLPLLSKQGIKRLKRATALIENMPTTINKDITKLKIKQLLGE